MSQYNRTKIAIMQGNYHTNKPKKPKEESFGASQAKKRPDSYDKLTPQEQWDIDKELGILDWGGE